MKICISEIEHVVTCTVIQNSQEIQITLKQLNSREPFFFPLSYISWECKQINLGLNFLDCKIKYLKWVKVVKRYNFYL